MHSNSNPLIDQFVPISNNSQFPESSLYESDNSPNNSHSSSNSDSAPDNFFTNSTPVPPRRHPNSAAHTQSPPRMNMSNPYNSVLTMPIPGTKLAPEKFRGDFHKVKEFIYHYERLCAQNNVTLDAEKCETLLRYCSKREKQTIQNIRSYTIKSWARLREDILRLYDADLDTKRYKVKDVRMFSKTQKGKRIRDLGGWKKYCRAFLRIAGSLLSEGKINDKDYATYFWQGIPRVLRTRLENRILTQDPVRDLSEPFGVEEIDTAAAAVLQRDQFDRALDDSDSESNNSSEDESSSDSDDESSDSDSEDEREKRRRRARKKKGRTGSRGSKKRYNKEESGGESDKQRRVSGERKEVEGLIRQMNLLTQDDPQYGIAYYRAMKLDPDVTRVVAEPILRRTYQALPQANVYRQQLPQLPQYPQGPGLYETRGPPPRAAPQQPPKMSEMKCFGCGELGHGMGRCPAISDLMSKGVLCRDAAGRVIYKDGTSIRRFNEETYVQAIERERRPQTHLVMVNNETDTEEDESDSVDDLYFDPEWDQKGYEDSGREDVFAIRDVGIKSYVAERPEKQITARKRMVLDGVYPPRMKDLAGGKENRPADPETGRPIRTGKALPSRTTKVKEVVARTNKGAAPAAVEDEPRYDAMKDREIIEDARTVKQARVQNKTNEEAPDEIKNPDRRLPRRSAISEHVNVLGVLDQVLNAKVELAVGEIIGVSRELSGQLANAMRMKSAKPSETVGMAALASTFRAKTHGLLIKIMVECDGRPINAIIDTGSQLNIVSEKICKSLIRRPVDGQASTSMNDANGGKRKLSGKVDDVPLNFGTVQTRASLYVGAHVPFDLLLGRPWQRGNFVSIDEEEDGTYLVFKEPGEEPGTMVPKYRVLVTPDAIVPNDWDFDPSTWYSNESPASYMVKDEEAEQDPEPMIEDWDEPISREIRGDYRYLNEWEFPSLYIGKSNNVRFKVIKPWLQRILCRAILKPWHKAHNLSAIREDGINKRAKELENSLSFLNPNTTTMEIKVGPASVQHEAELATLFSSPTTARSEAETLLAGLGDAPHFSRNQHLRDLVLSSHDGVVVGHTTDPTGYKRTDLMLLNMGLVASRTVGRDSPSKNLDVQYGTALVHFYPSLGGEAPPNWEIPYLFPSPPKISVSAHSCLTRTHAYSGCLKPKDGTDLPAGPNMEVAPALPVPLILDAAAHDSQRNASCDAVVIPCVGCLVPHDGPCANPGPTLLLEENSYPNGGGSSIASTIASVDSLPALQTMSESSSDSTMDTDDSIDSGQMVKKWNQFRGEMSTELQKARDERLKRWHHAQREYEENREYMRGIEMERDLQDEAYHDAEMTTDSDLDYSEWEEGVHLVSPASTPPPPFSPRLEPVAVTQQERLKYLELPKGAVVAPSYGRPLEQIRRLGTEQPPGLSLLKGPGRETKVVEGLGFDKPMAYSAAPVQAYSMFPVVFPPPVLASLVERPPTPFPDMTKPPNPYVKIPSGMDKEPTVEYKEIEFADIPSLDEDTSLVKCAETKCPAGDLEVLSGPEWFLGEDSIPSPTDTEPIEDLMLPPVKRSLPRPPVSLRPSYYRETQDEFIDTKMTYSDSGDDDDSEEPFTAQILPDEEEQCFEPHIIALNRDRGLYPFIETIRSGPITDESIPIQERPYVPYADMDVHYNIARVHKQFLVDLRDFSIARPQNGIPVGLSAVFTMLAPRNAPHGLVFPGLLWPGSFGPLDMPHVMARTLGDRLENLRKIRATVVAFIRRIRNILAPWQLEEINSPTITLFTFRGSFLIEKKVNRAMFFRIIHPVFNPLVTRAEGVFLRGACYALRKFQHDVVATAIDNTLRSPQLDIYMCQKLMERGCLEHDGSDEAAYEFLEDYERRAQGDRANLEDTVN